MGESIPRTELDGQPPVVLLYTCGKAQGLAVRPESPKQRAVCPTPFGPAPGMCRHCGDMTGKSSGEVTCERRPERGESPPEWTDALGREDSVC